MVAIVILTSEPHEYFTQRAQSHNELFFFNPEATNIIPLSARRH